MPTLFETIFYSKSALAAKALYRKITERDGYFVFWSSLFFYFLTLFNPNNKTLILLIFIYIFLLFVRFKSLKESLFWGFVTSLPFLVGKTYFFQMITASELFAPNNPQGYELVFVVTMTTLVAMFMLPFLIFHIWRLRKTQKFILDGCLFSLFLLVFIVFLSTIHSQNPPIAFLYFSQFLQYPLVFLYSRYIINWKKEETKNILILLLLSQVVFESAFVFMQFSKGGPLGRSIEFYQGIVPFGIGVDEDPWRYRPTGTFDHPNSLAAYLFPVLVINFAIFYRRRKEYLEKFGYYIFPFIFGLTALFITLGRSAWASLFLGILVVTFITGKRNGLAIQIVYKKRFLILAFLVFLLSPLFIFPRISGTFNSFVVGGGFGTRLELVKESLNLIGQNFFLGTGFGMSVPEMFRNNPRGMMYGFPTPVHNWYLFFASEAGVLALLAFIFLLNFSLRRISFAGEKTIFSMSIFIAVVALLFNGLFQPWLGSEKLLFIFLGILSTNSIKI